MKIAILGAGLTGLELGRRLKEIGREFIIFEKEPQIGGLCRTNKTGQYYWDFAVHAMYSRHRQIRDYFQSLPLDYEYLNRNTKIFHTGRDGKRYILDYPFEIGIKDLPPDDKMECIRGYIAVRTKDKKKPSNFEEWIYQRLGKGIARHFMVPYNKKIWNCRLSDISDELVRSKVEPTSVTDVVLSAFGKKIIGRTSQAKFVYPKWGIQKLADYTAKDIRDNILLNVNIKRLTSHRKGWTIIGDNGMQKKADIVISTIPLVELLKKINIKGLKKKYSVFKWNNTYFIMVALKSGHGFRFIKDCHWVFFKEDEIFYRITLMHNFCPEFFPVLVAEVTQKEGVLNKTQGQIRDLVIKDIVRKGIIGSVKQIAQTDIKLVEYTYPIPTLGLGHVKEGIRNVLKRNNIFLLGRSGNWDYINMDGIILNVQRFIAEESSAFQ